MENLLSIPDGTWQFVIWGAGLIVAALVLAMVIGGGVLQYKKGEISLSAKFTGLLSGDRNTDNTQGKK